MYLDFSSPASIGLNSQYYACQPSSEQLASLKACFLCSEIWADDPAVTLASLRVIGLIGDSEMRSCRFS